MPIWSICHAVDRAIAIRFRPGTGAGHGVLLSNACRPIAPLA
nr:hypothetical protein [Pseudomonas syringae pv. actinidiae]